MLYWWIKKIRDKLTQPDRCTVLGASRLWSYRSKSGWVWLILLSSLNDAAVEESSSKMRLFQKFSQRCGWCWKFLKDVAVPEVSLKGADDAESSSKMRLFQKFSQRCEWCWKFLKDAAVPEVLSKGRVLLEVPQRCGCSRSSLKGAGDAGSSSKMLLFQKFSQRGWWCWKFLKDVAVPKEFLKGAAAPCTSRKKKKRFCSSLRVRLHLFLLSTGAAAPCTPLTLSKLSIFLSLQTALLNVATTAPSRFSKVSLYAPSGTRVNFRWINK